MYMCRKCGESFYELPEYREERERGYEVLTDYDCPCCGAYEALEEAVECERCGELVLKDNSFVDNNLKYSCLDCAETGEPDYDRRLRKKGILHYDTLRIDVGVPQPC